MRGARRTRGPRALPAGCRRPVTLVVDEGGMICDCCTAAEELFGSSLRLLVTQHVSHLFPQLAGVELLPDGKVSPLLEDLCKSGHLFLAHRRHHDIFPSELGVLKLEEAGRRFLKLFVLPADDAAGALGG